MWSGVRAAGERRLEEVVLTTTNDWAAVAADFKGTETNDQGLALTLMQCLTADGTFVLETVVCEPCSAKYALTLGN